MTPQRVLMTCGHSRFGAFRMGMNSGRTFKIRHPKMVRVDRQGLRLLTFVSDSPDVYDRWKNESLLLVGSLFSLETSVA